MKKSKSIKIIYILMILTLVYGFTYIPHKLILIDSGSISQIVVTDGNTGQKIAIKDKEDINYIINNLNGVIFQKGKPSIGYVGFSFRAIIYNIKGEAIKEFTINSLETIRYNRFFYTAIHNQVDDEYIKEMFEKYPYVQP